MGSFLGLAACVLSLFGQGAQEDSTRPNLVIMMTDDQRHDALSCAGNTILKTPNLDRLAAEGVRFQNAFVTNALCAPSRATLLTGLYSHANGVMDNKTRVITPGIPLLSERLQAAGYEVAFCGKSHIQGALRDRKWDYYFGYREQGVYHNPLIAEGTDGKDIRYPGYMDDIVTDHAVAWLKKKRSKPFCLFLFFKAPHRSWQRAERHKDLFKNIEIPKPATWDDDRKLKPKAFADADNVIGNFKDVPSLDQFLKDYYATIVAVDENVGKVYDTLKGLGSLDRTAILFTADNGFFAGEWKAFDKRLMHEPSIRVPMLLRYPPLAKKGTLEKAMALNLDIHPTMLEIAGEKVPQGLHGKSLVPLLRGQRAGWRQDWLYEYFEFPGPHSVKKNRGVRGERYKFIHYFEEPQEYELYDLEKDPLERTNLAYLPEFALLRAKLAQRLLQLRQETGDK
ncbi:MAG: DUF4976 domain-containing protein [Gemmataceae bacterium]|nr:DUF4976 domain-containing protein [Gemmataceae bacterium]